VIQSLTLSPSTSTNPQYASALVVFFNYGVDTGTVWRSTPSHEPLLWWHVSWGRRSPDRMVKEQSRWGGCSTAA
jgi:hypothetical protein